MLAHKKSGKQMNTPKQKLRFTIFRLAAFFCATYFAFMTPAHAVWIDFDPWNDAVNTVTAGATSADLAINTWSSFEKAYDNIVANFQRAFAIRMQGKFTSMHMQATFDAAAIENGRSHYTNQLNPYTGLMPTPIGMTHQGFMTGGGAIYGKDTGLNLCHVNNIDTQKENLKNDIKQWKQAIEIFTQSWQSGGEFGSNTELNLEKDLCGRGFINNASLPLAQSTKWGCNSISYQYPMYEDKDTKMSTVLDSEFYDVPIGIGTTKAVPPTIILPVGQTANPTPSLTTTANLTTSPSLEMDFIAALYTCVNFQLPTGSSTEASGSGEDDHLYYKQRQKKKIGNITAGSCQEQIAIRTRVGQQAAGKNTLLEAMYDHQVSYCQSLLVLGKITPQIYADCEANGMSELMLDGFDYCGSGFNKIAVLLGNGVHDLNKTMEELRTGKSQCAQYRAKIASDSIALYNLAAAAANAGVEPERDANMHPGPTIQH